MNLLIALLGIGIFAYAALNLGEHHYHRPGWRPAASIALLCLAGWLFWPWIAPWIMWMMPHLGK